MMNALRQIEVNYSKENKFLFEFELKMSVLKYEKGCFTVYFVYFPS